MQQHNGPETLHSASEDSCNTTQHKSNISTQPWGNLNFKHSSEQTIAVQFSFNEKSGDLKEGIHNIHIKIYAFKSNGSNS